MCGRSRCAASHGAVAQALGVPQANWKDADKYRPTHNCCPGKYTPVLYTGENGERKVRVVRGEAWRKCSLQSTSILTPTVLLCQIRSMRWGLVPSYTKKDGKPDFWRMFNARCAPTSRRVRRLVSWVAWQGVVLVLTRCVSQE